MVWLYYQKQKAWNMPYHSYHVQGHDHSFECQLVFSLYIVRQSIVVLMHGLAIWIWNVIKTAVNKCIIFTLFIHVFSVTLLLIFRGLLKLRLNGLTWADFRLSCICSTMVVTSWSFCSALFLTITILNVLYPYFFSIIE